MAQGGAEGPLTQAPKPPAAKGSPSLPTTGPSATRAKPATAPAAPKAGARPAAPFSPSAAPKATRPAPPVAKPAGPAQVPAKRELAPTPVEGLGDDQTRVDSFSARAAERMVGAPASAVAATKNQRVGAPGPLRASVPLADPQADDAEIEPPVDTPITRPVLAESQAGVLDSMRTLLAQKVAPLEQTVRDLEKRVGELLARLSELERRPAPAPIVAPPPTALPVVAVAPPSPAPLVPSNPPTVVAAAPSAVPAARTTQASLHYVPAQLVDAVNAAADRVSSIDPEMGALDGRRRRSRLLLGVSLLLVTTFGALFTALAESYTHAHP